MRRREFIAVIGSAAVVWPIAARAEQSGKLPRVGILSPASNEAAATQTLEMIRDRGADGIMVRADVCQTDALTRMIGEVHASFGALDVFVHNALGNLLGFLSPPPATTLEQWDEAFRAQSRAFFVGMREIASRLRDRGRVIALSYWPGSHLGGFQPYFAMGTNKAAIEAMCRYYAVALASRGITVNAVCAGITDDSIVNQLPPEAQAAMFEWLRGGWSPSRRPTTPADVGGAVAALCSADAAWITGQTIVVDGGASLMSPEVPLGFQQT